MSHNPGPPPPYYPPQQGYSNREPRRTQPPPRQGRAGFGFAMFFLGMVFAVLLGAGAVYFLYFYNPNPGAPLPRPAAQSGTPDLSATLSQTYLNREIANSLSAKPFQAGAVTIRDIVVQVKGDSQMDISMRASTGPATFDLLVTESLSVQNGKVKITIIGQPKVTGGALPPSAGQIMDQVNNQFIEPQINNQVNALNINGGTLQLTGISTAPGFITISGNIS
jgi:hypothetical protein